MSGSTQTYKINTFSGVTIDGTSKFTGNKFLNSTDKEITLPTVAGTLATLANTETLEGKTLTTPTINGPTIQKSGSSTYPTISDARMSSTVITDSKLYSSTTSTTLTLPTSTDTLVGRNTTDILQNKTLTTPIIESLRQASGGGLISLPTATTAETLATQSYVTTALNAKDYDNDVAHDNLVKVVDRLITYLENWINVGNLTMSDVRSTVDSADKILPSTTGTTYHAPVNGNGSS